MNPGRASAGLICPKCQGEMRSYERNSVTVDQCTQCRGVFLDRGELEQLIDQESSYVADRGGPGVPYGSDDRRGHGDKHGSEHGGFRGGEHGDSRGGKRRGGILGNLFD